MNKNRLIALCLACTSFYDARNGYDIYSHVSNSELDIYREKEGKKATKPTSKALRKIARYLNKNHNVLMFVQISPFEDYFGIVLKYANTPSIPYDPKVSEEQRKKNLEYVYGLYREIRALGKKKKNKEKRDQLIQELMNFRDNK